MAEYDIFEAIKQDPSIMAQMQALDETRQAHEAKLLSQIDSAEYRDYLKRAGILPIHLSPTSILTIRLLSKNKQQYNLLNFHREDDLLHDVNKTRTFYLGDSGETEIREGLDYRRTFEAHPQLPNVRFQAIGTPKGFDLFRLELGFVTAHPLVLAHYDRAGEAYSISFPAEIDYFAEKALQKTSEEVQRVLAETDNLPAWSDILTHDVVEQFLEDISTPKTWVGLMADLKNRFRIGLYRSPEPLESFVDLVNINILPYAKQAQISRRHNCGINFLEGGRRLNIEFYQGITTEQFKFFRGIKTETDFDPNLLFSIPRNFNVGQVIEQMQSPQLDFPTIINIFDREIAPSFNLPVLGIEIPSGG